MRSGRVGVSGLEVSRLGLGTMQWADPAGSSEHVKILESFLQAGGSLVDTAAAYGEGAAESRLGDALDALDCRDEVVLTTKAGLVGKHRSPDASRGSLLDSLDRSLRRLRTDHVDIWSVHAWDPRTPLDETISALQSAVRSGKTRYIGICGFSAWQAVWAQQLARADVPLVCLQSEYSLCNRRLENDTVVAAAAMGLGVIAWSALGRGVLTGKYRYGIPGDSRAAGPWEPFVEPYLGARYTAIVDALARAAEGLGMSLIEVVLGWQLAQPHLAATLVGPRTADQAAELWAALDTVVPAAILSALDDVSEGVR